MNPNETHQELPTEIQRSPHVGSLLIFILAFVVRLLHTKFIEAAPFASYKIGDSSKYDLWAQEIANGNWLGTEVFYQAPLYPYFLATIYTCLGNSIATVRMVQMFLGAAACVFMLNAVTNLFDRKAGVVAGVLMAIYAPSIFLESLIQKSILDVFLLSALLWLVSKTLKSNRLRWWLWTGLTTGMLCLTRENALVVIPVLGLWAAFRSTSVSNVDGQLQKPSFGERGKTCAALFAGVIIALGPVAFRNYVVGGEFHVTTSQMGPNFYIGNNPKADGTYTPLKTGRGDAKFERTDAVEIAQAELGRKLSPKEVSDFYMAKSFAFISAQPTKWLRLMGRKTLLTFNATELVDTEDQYTHAIWSPVLSLLNFCLHFGVLVPLGFIGIWLTRQRRADVWWAYLMVGAFTASVIGFFVFGRYRFPMVPLLMLFAAPAIVHLFEMVREQGNASLVRFAPAFLLLFMFCNLPIVNTRLAQAITYSNFGVQALIRSDVAQAEEFFIESLRLQPINPVAHCNLAVLYWKNGNPATAREHFHKALEQNPEFDSAQERLNRMEAELATTER